MKLAEIEFAAPTRGPGINMLVSFLRAREGYELERVGDAVRARKGEVERFYPLAALKSWEPLVGLSEPTTATQPDHSAAQCVRCGVELRKNHRGTYCSKSCAARNREESRRATVR